MSSDHHTLSLPAQLPQLPTAIPDVIAYVGELVAGGSGDDARSAEAQAEAVALMLERERGSEAQARSWATAALVCARHVGRELEVVPRGRPAADAPVPLPELPRHERQTYRACAVPSDEEFRAWAEESPRLTRAALARHGAALKREREVERDPETGEPLDAPESTSSGEDGPPPSASPGGECFPATPPGESAFEPEDEPEQPEPATHRARIWLGLVERLLEELADAPPDVAPAAEEGARLIRRAEHVFRALLPHDTQGEETP